MPQAKPKTEPTGSYGQRAKEPLAADDAATGPAFFSRTLARGLAGSLLVWASLPPLDWWPLAWLAPIPWVLLIRRQELAGRKPYLALWLAGVAFWLLALHWLRLPHPATSIGWLALSAYLGVHLPVFIGLCRVAVHRCRWPVILAAPLVWTGLEMAQAHLLTGFNMASLGHTQYRWIALIQLSDLVGGYGVGFLVMFVAACLGRVWPCDGRRLAAWPLLSAAAAIAVSLLYGHWRLSQFQGRPGPKIALVQGSIDTEIKHDPGRQQLIYEQYFGLSQQAVKEHPDLDLVVWPETMFRDALLTSVKGTAPPESWTGTAHQFEELLSERRELIGAQAVLLGVPLLLGIDAVDFDAGRADHFNSALFVDRQGRIGARYDKVHRVLFGEYVPFGEVVPWFYNLTPLAAGIASGTQVPLFEVDGARLCANICYESTLAHVIRRQVDRLRREGNEPDILVNLTNDGWFWGSSELDLHLMCGVFRAVECRKPFLIAANTGFSAWIDADGRILRRGPRRDTGLVVAEVQLDNRTSAYLRWGDWPAGLALAASLFLAAVGLADRWRRR